jgi:hypothetical protein
MPLAPPQAAALRAVLEFNFSLRFPVAVHVKGHWLPTSSLLTSRDGRAANQIEI